MNYLTRLARQTGLIETPNPLAGPPTLEVIEEVEVSSFPDKPLPEERVEKLVPPEMHQVDHIEVADDLPKNPLPVQNLGPTVPDAPEEIPVQPTTVESLKFESEEVIPEETVAEDVPPDEPEDAFNISLQQVFEWVAQNDAPQPAQAGPSPEAATQVEPAKIQSEKQVDASRSELPELEIRTEQALPETIEVTAARTESVREKAEQPTVAPLPAEVSPAPQPSLVEERIDISIGTIELSVTPPASAPKPVAAPQPVMTAAPQPASLTNRLRRRYIRV